MEQYRFKLTAADRKASLNFKKIENDHKLFSTAANNCTNGVSFKRDGKRLVVDSITEEYIEISLYSSTPLVSPTRTLSAFSRELLRLDKSYEPRVLENSIYNHTLFSTESLKLELKGKKDIKDIPDSTYLKTFIDLIYSSENLDDLNSIKSILIKHIV